jgi:hypothetical protein
MKLNLEIESSRQKKKVYSFFIFNFGASYEDDIKEDNSQTYFSTFQISFLLKCKTIQIIIIFNTTGEKSVKPHPSDT